MARRLSFLCAAAVLLWVSASMSGQDRNGPARPPSLAAGDWPHYTADLKGTRYSPLDQINGTNFSKLEVAWRFKTDSLGPRPEYKLEGTPLAINGVLYTTGGTRRSVVALDGKTGELIWAHSLREGKRAGIAPRQLSGRGLSYWTDGRGDERILYITTGYRLVALNAKTGAPISSFGTNGIVDLKVGAVYGNRQPIDLETGEIGVHSTPVVVKDVALVGSSFREGATVSTHNNTKGLVRAFDVRTGKVIWTFNTIPRPGEFGNESWENDSWSVNGNVGCTGSSTTVELRRSPDGMNWSAPTTVSLSQPGLYPWHIDVEWIPSRNEFWALYNAKTPASCTTGAVYLATSSDGLQWTTYPSPVLARGAIPELQDVVYRSTFAYDDASDASS